MLVGVWQEKITNNTWFNNLYAATGLPGGEADVNLDVWQTDSADAGNISGMKITCQGMTNGIDTVNNC